jgi:small-conductance mechanosensitive channel
MDGVIAFVDRYDIVGLGVALVVVAFLVNRWALTRRRRIRAGLVMYLLFVAAEGAQQLLRHAHFAQAAMWADGVRIVGALLGAFTCVRLLALLVFDVLLPATRITILQISGDITVGLAYALAAFGMLKACGVEVAPSVLATSAIVSGVVALSLQTTLGNILGGVALQLDGSVHVGDWLQLPDGQQGQVMAIRWRHTVVETRNWDTLLVPNASLLAQNILILGKRTGKPLAHRMWVYFNVDFRFPPSRIIEVVRDALHASAIPGVASEPAPTVICYDLSRDGKDSYAYYAARYWLTDLANDDPTSSRVRTIIYAALRRADIPLARPSRTLFVEAEENDVARAARHKDRRLNEIDRVEIFHSLTPAEKEYIAARLRDAPFTAGETVTRQGAIAHWLYILCEGTVEIRRHGADPSMVKTVATIAAPGFFGEMGMLAGEPRRADVVALTDVDCYRLDKEGLEHLLHERPEIAESISKTLAQREIGLDTIDEGLDEEARRARMVNAEGKILEKIQAFFGLERTTRV